MSVPASEKTKETAALSKGSKHGRETFSGSASHFFQSTLLREIRHALPTPPGLSREEQHHAFRGAVEAMKEIAPRGPLEGMLTAQMVSVHQAAMECLRRAMIPDQTIEGLELSMRQAAKLMALYERQLAALDKHRGKGRQKITVEHVTVEAGGQAIVGEVHTDGKSKPEKAEDQSALPDNSTGKEISREQLKSARKKSAKGRK